MDEDCHDYRKSCICVGQVTGQASNLEWYLVILAHSPIFYDIINKGSLYKPCWKHVKYSILFDCFVLRIENNAVRGKNDYKP